jgi:hypothetical protein
MIVNLNTNTNNNNNNNNNNNHRTKSVTRKQTTLCQGALYWQEIVCKATRLYAELYFKICKEIGVKLEKEH